LYLSKLELFGFKSFANKTVINFTKGITGIVGPNGCGKTNIVDAIRWVLGEQKSSTLRSDKMENVIFNGTKFKKPLGMAEVSLTLMNDEGKLPTDYTEVKITRRIFRSGESEYLLNNNICRLKDITNLFMDTGVAANAYSVIELKMIETILSNKAEERRRLFEEAAGVNKYKLRRRLSLKKLDEVKSDLTRVNDIVSEVEKKVRSLERQAKKTDKYNQIQSILREKEIELAEREFALYNKNLSQLKEKEDQLQQAKSLGEEEIVTLEENLHALNNQIVSVENKLAEKRSQLTELTNRMHENQKNISVNTEKVHSLKENIERYRNELQELEEQKIFNLNLIEQNSAQNNRLRIEIENLEKEIAQLEDLITSNKILLDEKKTEFKKESQKAIDSEKELNKLENNKQTISEKEIAINRQINELENKIQKITDKIAKTAGYLEDLELEKESIKSKIEESDKYLKEKQKEKTLLEKELSRERKEELEIKGVINNLKNKIEFLQNLIANLEGVSKGSKILLETEGWTQKKKNLISDVGGSSDEKYYYALNAALKNVLNNLLIEDLSDLKKAIEYLRKNNLGKASFILLSRTNGRKGISIRLKSIAENRLRNKLSKRKGFAGWAFKFVKTEKKWQPFFKKILENTAVVTTLDVALKLIGEFPDFNFVTINGDYVKSNGIIEAGSEPKLDETIFGRKQMLENLRNELPKLEAKLKTIQNSIELHEQNINNIDLNNISEQGRILLNDLNNIEKQINQFEFEKIKAAEEIDSAQEQIRKLATESNNLNSQFEKIAVIIKEKQDKLNETTNSIKELEAKLNEFENEFNNKKEKINTLKLKLERTRGDLKNNSNAIERAKRTLDAIKHTEEKRKIEIVNSQEEIQTLETILEEDETYYQELLEKSQILNAEKNEIEAELTKIKETSGLMEEKLKNLRQQREEISEEIYKINIERNKLSLQIENLKEHIKETYSLELTLKEFDDLDNFDLNALADEVQTLKVKIKNLGPINLLAYSEFEEEKERLDFLLKQRNDLLESEKDLIATIKETNETAEKIFLETFEQIRENFKKTFQTLFNPGDEADLQLEEGVDPLEAKIFITAKPKGKRPTSIDLLSQGEKTLTATALLFAIYLVKPSPFCILDEVDAPLDDANVTRFTRLLKEFSNNTQFVIITHNKRTMEAAENIYGVTIQEEGISKLVGVQFNAQLEKAAQ